MRRLDFFILGAQKCGTTALWHFLRQHPAIFLPNQKEVHFFDDESYDWQRPDYSRLYAHFAGAKQTQIWGEATPVYVFWPSALSRIMRYNPHVKLIVILRDPVARAYSHWRMQMVRGLETFPFHQAVREGRTRVNFSAHNTMPFRMFSYVERGFYGGQVARLLYHTARSSILFLSTMQLKSQHRATLDSICDFLSIAKFESYPEEGRIFSSESMDASSPAPGDIVFLRSLYEREMALAQFLTGVKFEDEI